MFSIECVLHRMCSLYNMFFIECVLKQMEKDLLELKGTMRAVLASELNIRRCPEITMRVAHILKSQRLGLFPV